VASSGDETQPEAGPEGVGASPGSLLGAVSWAYAARYSAKALTFVATVILARLLLKEDFGLAGFALIVIGFLEVTKDLGIGASVIFYGDDDESLDTAFWLNIGSGLLLGALAWAIAPLVGGFFGAPRATSMTRVLALSFPLMALGNIHRSILERRLAFRRLFIPDLAKAIGKGTLSISLALLGFGAWSLVIGHLGGTAVSVVAYWLVLRWRPAKRFVRTKAAPLLRYGIQIVAVNVVGVLLNNLDYLVVGRYLGAEALGVYILAFRLPELLIKELSTGASRALFPAFSSVRSDPGVLRERFLNTMSYLALVMVPAGLGLAAVADPLVRTLYTDKWEQAIPVMSVIAVYLVVQGVAFNIGDIYKATGRPTLLTKISLVRLPVLLAMLWWAVTGPGTLLAVGFAQLGSAVFTVTLSVVVAARVLAIRPADIWGAFRAPFLAGVGMVAAVLIVLRVLPSQIASWLELTMGIAVGVGAYMTGFWLFDRQKLISVLRAIRTRRRTSQA